MRQEIYSSEHPLDVDKRPLHKGDFVIAVAPPGVMVGMEGIVVSTDIARGIPSFVAVTLEKKLLEGSPYPETLICGSEMWRVVAETTGVEA